jgi:phosphatidate cytidylyltransferase
MASVPRPRLSNFQARLMSAAVGIPLLVGVVWFGGYLIAAVAVVVVFLALRELLALIHRSGWGVFPNEGLAWGAAVVGAGAFGGDIVLLAFGAGAALVLVAGFVYRRSAIALGDWSFTAMGVAYVSFPLAAVVLIRSDDVAGIEWLALAFGATFATDTGAYAVGRAIGRHKMAPSISPAKTWEGAAGGLLAAVAATIAIIAIVGDVANAYWHAAALGIGIGVVGQVGDLLESKLKRLAKVKDSGVLIPGHGGVLDRLDSLVVVFPLVYYASKVWPVG